MKINPLYGSSSETVHTYEHGVFKVISSDVTFHYNGSNHSRVIGYSGHINLLVTPNMQGALTVKFNFNMENTKFGTLSVVGTSTLKDSISIPIDFEVYSPLLPARSANELVEKLCRILLSDLTSCFYTDEQFIRIKPDFIAPNHELRECAFIWLYSSEDLTCHKSDELVPFIMTFTRWDGKLGTIGGKLEAGETPVQGAMREAKEELSESFGSHPLETESNLQKLCTFLDEKSGVLIHSFAMCLPYERLIDLSNRFFTEKLTKKRELCGISFVPCANYRNPRNNEVVGIKSYLKNEFSATAKLELNSLIGNLKCRNILRHE